MGQFTKGCIFPKRCVGYLFFFQGMHGLSFSRNAGAILFKRYTDYLPKSCADFIQILNKKQPILFCPPKYSQVYTSLIAGGGLSIALFALVQGLGGELLPRTGTRSGCVPSWWQYDKVFGGG